MNEKIKKLIFMLLLFLTVYILIIVLPYIIIVLKFIGKIAFPFVLAFVLAFILQPVIVIFQKKFSRKTSVFLVLGIFTIVLVTLVIIMVPKLVAQVEEFMIKLPDILSQVEVILNDWCQKLKFIPENFQPNFENLNLFFNKYIIKNASLDPNFINKLFSYLTWLILLPTILIYFLLDYEKILCTIRNYLLKHNKIRFKNYLAEISKTLSVYFRSVLIVMLIVSIMFTVAFYIIDLEYAMFFGIVLGITNIIPYLGAYIGGALPILIALLDSPRKALVVLGISIVLQTLESDIITPCIQSKNMKINPLLVILSVLVFGALFGIIGMMSAVPVVAMIKITLKYYPIKKVQNL